MVYLDTSALVPLFIPEPASGRVRARLAEMPAGEPAVNEWTLVEFASAIGARVRAGTVAVEDGTEAMAALEAMAAGLQRLVPGREDYHTAARLVARFASGLRAGDALHLAIAARCTAQMFTLDRVLRRAARAQGLHLVPL